MGISAPRSPRAIITPPDASMMLSRLSTAARVSILAITSGPRGCGSTPRRRMSWAERTNDSATMSTPSSTKASSMCRSSGVGDGMRRRSDGMCTPGRPWSRPPWVIRATRWSAVRSVTSATTRPSPKATLSPTCMSTRRPSWSTWSSSLVDPSYPGARRMTWPSSTTRPPSGMWPARTLGPGRSIMVPMGRLSACSTRRTRRNFSMASSSEPWASPMRATSMPASARVRIIASESDAGPMVAMIFVRRAMAQCRSPALPAPRSRRSVQRRFCVDHVRDIRPTGFGGGEGGRGRSCRPESGGGEEVQAWTADRRISTDSAFGRRASARPAGGR